MQPPVVADQSRDRAASLAGRGHAEALYEGLGDLRFRALLSALDWDALPPTVRWRFSRRLAGGMTVVYVGRVSETRMSRAGFPQIIHSAKRFAGPTGLEEYVGYGVGMALTVHIEPGALVFRSAGYFVQLFGRRVAWPAWLSPGYLTVTHGARDDGAFTFTLDLVHPRVGGLIRQTAIFREAAP
jgi:hypothetical protein